MNDTTIRITKRTKRQLIKYKNKIEQQENRDIGMDTTITILLNIANQQTKNNTNLVPCRDGWEPI